MGAVQRALQIASRKYRLGLGLERGWNGPVSGCQGLVQSGPPMEVQPQEFRPPQPIATRPLSSFDFQASIWVVPSALQGGKFSKVGNHLRRGVLSSSGQDARGLVCDHSGKARPADVEIRVRLL